jgi:hypothetical protein
MKRKNINDAEKRRIAIFWHTFVLDSWHRFQQVMQHRDVTPSASHDCHKNRPSDWHCLLQALHRPLATRHR